MSDDLHEIPSEDELQLTVPEEEGPPVGPCPAQATWQSLVAGEYSKDEQTRFALLDHLAGCDRCESELARIRFEGGRKRTTPNTVVRNPWLQLRVAIVVVSLFLLTATWFWTAKRLNPATVVVDLRQAITRDADSHSGPGEVILRRGTGRIRVLLPADAAEGEYQFGIFSSSDLDHPIQRYIAMPWSETDHKVLQVLVDLKSFTAGTYRFGIRRPGQEWSYYPFLLE